MIAPSASVKFHLRTETLGAKDNGEIPGATGYWLGTSYLNRLSFDFLIYDMEIIVLPS